MPPTRRRYRMDRAIKIFPKKPKTLTRGPTRTSEHLRPKQLDPHTPYGYSLLRLPSPRPSAIPASNPPAPLRGSTSAVSLSSFLFPLTRSGEAATVTPVLRSRVYFIALQTLEYLRTGIHFASTGAPVPRLRGKPRLFTILDEV